MFTNWEVRHMISDLQNRKPDTERWTESLDDDASGSAGACL